jgi:class 3 adenylate cyclase
MRVGRRRTGRRIATAAGRLATFAGAGAHNPPMTHPPSVASRRAGTLLLADISGYTGFLGDVTSAHLEIVDTPEPPAAYSVMSHLLDTIVDAIAPGFELTKVEGDAVFAVSADEAPSGPALVTAIHAWYDAFRAGLERAKSEWQCTCSACVRISDLDLKFILHRGTWIAQAIAGHEELLGPDVNLVHRLLKNHARELIGLRPYALLTASAVDALAVPPDGFVRGLEDLDGIGPVEVRVLALV